MSDAANLPQQTEKAEQFPRGKALPSQSPLFWVQQKDRYLRQLLIKDIEAETGRRLLVYFSNRFKAEAQIDQGDVAYMAELFGDLGGDPVDLLIETNGGATDATEALVSFLKSVAANLRVIVVNAAKSNGTMICLAAHEILMGATSELGPIDPALNGVPASILVEAPIAQQNYPLHRLAAYAIQQTEKLATQLLRDGMLKGKSEPEIALVVKSLSTKDVFHSHGSVIDHREASALGLKVRYLPEKDELWQRLWLLHCMYAQDLTSRGYLKVFEGRQRSTTVASPSPTVKFVLIGVQIRFARWGRHPTRSLKDPSALPGPRSVLPARHPWEWRRAQSLQAGQQGSTILRPVPQLTRRHSLGTPSPQAHPLQQWHR